MVGALTNHMNENLKIMAENKLQEFAERCSEAELYFIIDECGAFIWRMNHDLADGRIEDHDGKIAMDMMKQGMINKKTALMRIEPNKLDELLHPVFDGDAITAAKVVAKGLPASPGAATGQVVFHADEAEDWVAAALDV